MQTCCTGFRRCNLQRLQGMSPMEVTPAVTSRSYTRCNLWRLHEETSLEISLRNFLKRGASRALPDGRALRALLFVWRPL